MSRRIRSIKPEIIEDEKIGPLSDTAFRLFTSMITIADDFGNVRSDVRWLQAQIWWAHADPPNVLPALLELVRNKLIDVYGVRGGTYAHLRGWEKHQRVDNAGKGKVPPPKDPDALVFDPEEAQSLNGPLKLAASRGELPRDSAGWDGIGDEGKGVSGLPDPAASLAEIAVAEINRFRGARYAADSVAILKDCRALAKAKYTPEQVKAVIASKADWIGDAKMGGHFKPSVLLRPSNFAKYLDDVNAGGSKPSQSGNSYQQSPNREDAISPLMLAFEDGAS